MLDPNNLELVPWQEHALYNDSRYRVIVAGRRSGKTTFATLAAYLHAFDNPDSVVWICALTYGQCKELYWRQLVGQNGVIPKLLISDLSISDLSVTLINGSVIKLKGTNNVDGLLGSGLDLLIIDETQSHHPDVFDLLTPMLADKQGKMIMIGTPRSYNHFYDYFSNGWYKSPSKKDKWCSYQIKTAEAGTVPAEEIEEAKERMSLSVFKQEFEASFESIEGLAYYSFSEDNISDEIDFDPNQPLLIGMDFNVAPMTAVVLQRHNDMLYALDEIYLENSNTPAMADEIIRRYGDKWKGRIHLYPDPAGNSRSTALRNGGSNFTILKSAPYNFNVIARPKHPAITDRVNAVNGLLCNASGRRRLLIHPRCVNLIKTLKGLIVDTTTGQPGKGIKFGNLDHMSDALGYPIEFIFPIRGHFVQHGLVAKDSSIIEQYTGQKSRSVVSIR